MNDPTRSAGEPAVQARHLSVCYDRKPALWEAELEIPRGSMTGIVGPNGAGKSTLIKAMLELVPVSGGSVTFFGKSYREARDRIAYVPQRESVDWEYPISARDVVAMGLYRRLGLFRWVTREAKRAAQEALDRVGMSAFVNRRIGALSGGQQQRVFLARALVQKADLYLMDEPFAGIDATTEQVILDLMRGLRAEGATLACVHHDLATVAEKFDHAVLLNLRVVACGAVSSVFHRENLARCYGGRLEMFSSDEGAFTRLGTQAP
ncbi:MAG: metal ABC transporter ATP-binding protein [Planctomycetota bacterium]|nr:metal ABC transporter ATP-binding protein [Planctomycetota bacterium]